MRTRPILNVVSLGLLVVGLGFLVPPAVQGVLLLPEAIFGLCVVMVAIVTNIIGIRVRSRLLKQRRERA